MSMKKLLKDNPERVLAAVSVLFAAIAIGISMLFLSVGADEEKTDSIKYTGKETVFININTATEEELKALDGISDVIAKEIVAYREKHGDFASKEDLLQVSGIGEKKLNAISKYIRVE